MAYVKKLHTFRPNRGGLPRGASLPSAAAVVTSAISATKWRVTCSGPVVVGGVPKSFTVNNAVPTAITVVSPTVFDLTFAVAVAAGQAWKVAANEPNVRTFGGGYVAAAAGTF